MRNLEAQVVIAVHSADRPVRRATESVLADPAAGAIVVAHGVAPNTLDLPGSPRLLVVPCTEGLGRPGVPFNRGLAQVTAPLSGIMGSDDWYESGAISAMVTRQRTDRADGVLAPLTFPGRGSELNPLTIHTRKLRARRDRLFTRTAPLGLFRTDLMQNPRYQMREDVPVGGDHQPSLHLWTDGLDISHYPTDPAYVVGADAVERVTTKPRPISVSLAPLVDLIDDGTVASLNPGDQIGLITKQLRVHILHPVERQIRSLPGGVSFTQAQLNEYSRVARVLHEAAPAAIRHFTAADQDVLAAILRGPLAGVAAAVAHRATAPLIQRILPRQPLKALSPEANLRMAGARLVAQSRMKLTKRLRRSNP